MSDHRRPGRLWGLVVLSAIAATALRSPGDALAGPSAQAYVEQAIVLYHRGECRRAIVLLTRAVAAAPRYVRAYSWMGFCHAKLGRTQEAVAAFNRVIALAPWSEDARIARQWIARLQSPAVRRPTSALQAAPSPASTPPGLVYLVTLPAAAGVTADNRPRQIQLFGVIYRHALVERRNWWRGRRPTEREWRVVYNLQRRFSRFRALAGVEDGSPPEFTATFEVRADGAVLFEGHSKRAGDVPDTPDLDVAGVLQLELIVRGYDPLHTRDLSVVWADPVLDARPAITQPALPPSPAGPPVPPPASPPPASPSPGG
ncbi:MAG: NPCBM/NEW2 domain-containing protein [Armatimonadota bacterium]|nr:NPCBM/NEW2 domain-containing protein [Armatimonadota bacterium]